MSAIRVASNLGFHEDTKHIEFDCHFTQENNNRKLSLFLICLPNVLAKTMTHDSHRFLIKLMFLDSPVSLLGEV